MPAPIGATFMPSFEQQDMAVRPSQTSRPLQTLSFQLSPRVIGSRGGISPLQGSQMAGSPVSRAVLASVLRTIMGPDAAAEFLGGSVGGGGSQASPSGGSQAFAGMPRDQGQFDMTQFAPPTQARQPVIHPGSELAGDGGSGTTTDERFGAGDPGRSVVDDPAGASGPSADDWQSALREQHTMNRRPMPAFQSFGS